MRHPRYLGLTAAELLEWLAVYQVEPWGELRQDLRSAANAIHSSAAHRKASELPDLVYPYFDHPQSDPAYWEMIERARAS